MRRCVSPEATDEGMVDGQLSAGSQVDAGIVLRLCWTLSATNLRRFGWRFAFQEDDSGRVGGIAIPHFSRQNRPALRYANRWHRYLCIAALVQLWPHLSGLLQKWPSCTSQSLEGRSLSARIRKSELRTPDSAQRELRPPALRDKRRTLKAERRTPSVEFGVRH